MGCVEASWTASEVAVSLSIGFTPMAKIISAALGQSDETCVTLLFANRTEKDILWQAELERLQKDFSTRWASHATVTSSTIQWGCPPPWHSIVPHTLNFLFCPPHPVGSRSSTFSPPRPLPGRVCVAALQQQSSRSISPSLVTVAMETCLCVCVACTSSPQVSLRP